jgi:hypothetical protein
MFKGIAGLSISLLCCSTVRSGQNADSAAQVYKPGQTKVAILPTADASGETNKTISEKQRGFVDRELVKEFRERGFRCVDHGTLTDALRAQSIDLSDEEQQKRSPMIAGAKAVGADLTVFVLITDMQKTGHPSAVKVWLLDVNQGKAILNAQEHQGRVTYGVSWTHVLPRTVSAALEVFMKNYAVVPKKDQQPEERSGG